MKWVFVDYSWSKPADGDGYIKPSFCHPMFYKHRIAHVSKKYGAEPAKLQRVDTCWVDLGGMISTDDAQVTIELGTDRYFGCWLHQVSDVIRILESSTPQPFGRCTYRRFARWPGVICFISEKDCRRVLRGLRRHVDLPMEEGHRLAMRESLVKAQGKGDPEREAEIRAMLVRQQEKYKEERRRAKQQN